MKVLTLQKETKVISRTGQGPMEVCLPWSSLLLSEKCGFSGPQTWHLHLSFLSPNTPALLQALLWPWLKELCSCSLLPLWRHCSYHLSLFPPSLSPSPQNCSHEAHKRGLVSILKKKKKIPLQHLGGSFGQAYNFWSQLRS